jgi:hypothetical protein
MADGDWLELFDFQPLHATIVAAGGADPVRDLGIPATRTGAECRHLRLHVRAPLALALLALTSLGNGHERDLSSI